ncbi:MAG: hypothetical protein COB67_07695, partial [SAR324 cluster bacterium]
STDFLGDLEEEEESTDFLGDLEKEEESTDFLGDLEKEEESTDFPGDLEEEDSTDFLGDLEEEESTTTDFLAEKQPPMATPKTPTEEYLEAVRLSDESKENQIDFGLGTISSDHKYKFFLKPEPQAPEKPEVSPLEARAEKSQESSAPWPEIQDEIAPPPLEAGAVPTTASDGIDFEEYSTDAELKELNEDEALTTVDSEPSSKGKLIALISLVVLLLVGGGWLLLKRAPLEESSLAMEEVNVGQEQLTILEPLDGQYITNRNFSSRIFVLKGKLSAQFAQNTSIESIQVKGILYGPKDQEIAAAQVLAGTNLSNSQLKTWNKKKILAFQQAQGTRDLSTLGTKQSIPFQIVFFKVPAKIIKLEARIAGYQKNGEQIDL